MLLGSVAALVIGLVTFNGTGSGQAGRPAVQDAGSLPTAGDGAGPSTSGSSDAGAATAAATVTTAPTASIGRRPAGLEALRQDAAPPAPVRLEISTVGLDVPLDAVGVRSDGLMEIPDDGDRAGWYRFGPAPGSDQGAVVLAGHVDTPEGEGAMAVLADVEPGDQVTVWRSDGSSVIYEVVSRRSIDKRELPVEQVFARDGPPRLTLVTCGGPWRFAAESYRDNVVVDAVPVPES